MTACRYAAVPGHVCAGPVHLYLAGGLCEAAAPPAQPIPPAGTTLTDLREARGLSQAPNLPSWTVLDDRAVASGRRRSSSRVYRAARDAEAARKDITLTTTTGPDFGPQHTAVTALLARARALTPVEQEAIVARARAMAPDLRDAKHAAAVHMGWRDPHNAVATIRAAQTPGAPDPGGHALLFTGWRAGFHATAVPILCDVLAWTVLALTGRHILPGPAYEALTRCWAQVIGRAHPDDVRTLEDSMFPAGVAR